MKFRTRDQLSAWKTNAAIKAAHEQLGDYDRQLVDEAAAIIYRECRQRHTGKTPLGLGPAGRLELLAKLGIWMLEE
jgi:hypothetical protein